MSTKPEPDIGVLGGTFNPIHLGHLPMAQDAMDAFELAKTLFVPCATPPHKRPATLLPAKHRLAMLEAAIESDVNFEVSDIEIRRPGVSYSVVTMHKLKELYPRSELRFIIGSDTLTELHLWKDIYRLLELCRFAIVERPGAELASIKESDIKLEKPWPARLLKNVTRGHMIDISSSDIRYRLAEGMSIRHLVPRAVEIYISEHHLYRRSRH